MGKLVFDKVKEKLGFQNCQYFLTGAAPVARKVLDFWAGFDIRVSEGYGMSECAGVSNGTRASCYVAGSTGSALNGTEVKIFHDPDRDEPGKGEICMRGRI